MNNWYEDYFATINPSNGIPDNNGEPRKCPPCMYIKSSTKEYYDRVDDPGEDFDWQGFWAKAKKLYPLHSVHGGYTFDSGEKISQSEYSLAAEQMPAYFRILGKRVLEIGYGFGGAAEFFKDHGAEYHGIDYVRSDENMTDEEGFHVIEKSGIPDWLMEKKFDLVYSYNVFQHLTQAQRIEYFRQVYEVLKPGGQFVVSVFSKTDKFVEDPKHVYAARFFGVATAVDETDFLDGLIKDIGFRLKTQDFFPTSDPRTAVRIMKLVKPK